MLAAFFMAFFGLLAVIGSQIITNSSESIKQINQITSENVKQTFKSIRTIIEDGIIPQELVLRTAGCPGSPPANRFNAYVCRPEFQGLYNWNSQGNTLDPWGGTIQSVVRTESIPIFAGSGQAISIPVTAVALVSGGPDRRIHPTTLTALNALATAPAGSANIAAVKRLERIRPDDDASDLTNPADDDIVYTFTTENAQLDKWKDIRTDIENIGNLALRNYQANFSQFSGNSSLYSIYEGGISSFFAAGKVTLADASLDMWKTAGAPTRPEFDLRVFENSSVGRDIRERWGISSAFNNLQNLGMQPFVDITSDEDNLVITVRNRPASPSPWVFSGTGFKVSYAAN